MNAWVAVVALLVVLGAGLVLLVVTGLLAVILLALGVVVFVAMLAAITVAAVALLIAIPYYFVAKKAQVTPGSYDLAQLRER